MLPNPLLQTKTGTVFLFKLSVGCKPLITVIKPIQQDIRLLFQLLFSILLDLNKTVKIIGVCNTRNLQDDLYLQKLYQLNNNYNKS